MYKGSSDLDGLNGLENRKLSCSCKENWARSWTRRARWAMMHVRSACILAKLVAICEPSGPT